MVWFILRNSSCFMEIDTLKMLFSTFVRYKLKYASTAWDPKYNIHINNLEKV